MTTSIANNSLEPRTTPCAIFSKIGNHIYENTPSFSQVMKNAQKVAIPSIAFIAISNLPTARGGILLELVCYASCSAFAAVNPVIGVPWWPTCVNVCNILGFMPTP
jgi:hypothetical protein